MRDFLDFARSCGVMPPHVLVPGKWQRCGTLTHPRKKNASIKLSEDGNVGWVHDFSSMAEPVIWRPDKAENPTLVSQEEIASRLAAKRREMIQATKDARAYFSRCQPLRESHPYLKAKGLGLVGCFGLRVDPEGWLVIPMHLRGALVSVQRINDAGTKLFWSGASTNAASYVIQRQRATVTLFCEGFATGATLFSAVPNSRVFVAFNAGNLPRVAREARAHGLVAVCADNDRSTAERLGKNPGVIAATEAAEILGCGLAIPECEAGTDFDDWRQELLKQERQENLFRMGHKLTPAQMLANVEARIRAHIMAAVKFVPIRG